MSLPPKHFDRASLPMYLDRFLLKSDCRYGVLLSTNLEVLAIVDTKTEEVKANKEELYGY